MGKSLQLQTFQFFCGVKKKRAFRSFFFAYLSINSEEIFAPANISGKKVHYLQVHSKTVVLFLYMFYFSSG